MTAEVYKSFTTDGGKFSRCEFFCYLRSYGEPYAEMWEYVQCQRKIISIFKYICILCVFWLEWRPFAGTVHFLRQYCLV